MPWPTLRTFSKSYKSSLPETNIAVTAANHWYDNILTKLATLSEIECVLSAPSYKLSIFHHEEKRAKRRLPFFRVLRLSVTDSTAPEVRDMEIIEIPRYSTLDITIVVFSTIILIYHALSTV